MKKPRIRHLAFIARDPDKLAKFYQDVFDMELIYSRGPGRSQFLSDGYLTIAILKHNLAGTARLGLDHFGFDVDDPQEYIDRIVAPGWKSRKAGRLIFGTRPNSARSILKAIGSNIAARKRCGGAMKRHRLLPIVAAAALLSLLPISRTQTRLAAQGLPHIRAGTNRNVGGAAIYFAQELGFFKRTASTSISRRSRTGQPRLTRSSQARSIFLKATCFRSRWRTRRGCP